MVLAFLLQNKKERGYLQSHANEETWFQRYPLYLVDIHIIKVGVGLMSIGKMENYSIIGR